MVFVISSTNFLALSGFGKVNLFESRVAASAGFVADVLFGTREMPHPNRYKGRTYVCMSVAVRNGHGYRGARGGSGRKSTLAGMG